MLSLVETRTRAGICHDMQKKTINIYMRGYNKNKESSYLMYRDTYIITGRQLSIEKKTYLGLIRVLRKDKTKIVK